MYRQIEQVLYADEPCHPPLPRLAQNLQRVPGDQCPALVDHLHRIAKGQRLLPVVGHQHHRHRRLGQHSPEFTAQ